MIVRRLSVLVLVGLLTLLGSAGVANAHTRLESSDPAEGAALATAPAQVTLTFSEPVSPPEGAVEIIGPDNVTWQVGAVTAAGATITAPVTPTGPAGAYVLAYRVVSSDGHTVAGSVNFTLTTAPAPPTTTTTEAPPPTTTTEAPADDTSEPAASTEDSGGVPLWVWLVVALVVIVAAVTMVLRSRRSS